MNQDALANITTETLKSLASQKLQVWHNRMHAAFDAGRLTAAQKAQAAQVNLMLHQELCDRGDGELLARLDLDEASSEFGVQKGLQHTDLEDCFLPLHACDEISPERFVKFVQVEKKDDDTIPVDKNIVFGVVLEPNETDAHKDTVNLVEIEREAHLWLARKQNRGLMHKTIVNSKLEIYESYIAPVDLTLAKQKVKKGTWLLMLHVLDKDLWNQIKKGELTGFSIGGLARKRPL